MKSEKRQKLTGLLLLCVVVVTVSCVINLLSYQYDNKYTYRCRQAESGVLQLDEQVLAQTPVLFLTGGWELYRDRLLTPADFEQATPTPDLYTFIGEFSGFEGADRSRSPHGSATYRMFITLPQQAQNYTLELPEIYSSCRVYINGALMAERGNPDPRAYRAETKSSAITFRAGGQAEIIVAVSDFSHFYSGMVYPPAFGEPEAVASLLNTRLVARAAICTIALGIGIFYLFVGLFTHGNGNQLPLIYGLLCLCFVGYASYPIYTTLVGGGVDPWYASENICYLAMLTLLIILHGRVCAIKNNFTRFMIFWGMLLCFFAGMIFLLIRGSSLQIMLVYSYLIDGYKWALACYLTIFTIAAVYRETLYSKILLAAILVFDCALVMDRLLPLYEPIKFGWFIEMAGFMLVIAIGCVLGLNVIQQYKTKLLLEETAKHMRRQLFWQAEQYQSMMTHIDETKKNRHDLRHQLTVLKSYANAGNMNGLLSYIDAYIEKLHQYAELPLCDNYAAGAVARYYCSLAKNEGIQVDVKLDIPQKAGCISDIDLCIVLGNLLENALEACRRMESGQRFIHVYSNLQGGYLAISVINSFDGIVLGERDVYHSRKHLGEGYGLSSVRAIANRYNGTVCYETQGAEFKSSVVIRV